MEPRTMTAATSTTTAMNHGINHTVDTLMLVITYILKYDTSQVPSEPLFPGFIELGKGKV